MPRIKNYILRVRISAGSSTYVVRHLFGSMAERKGLTLFLLLGLLFISASRVCSEEDVEDQTKEDVPESEFRFPNPCSKSAEITLKLEVGVPKPVRL